MRSRRTHPVLFSAGEATSQAYKNLRDADASDTARGRAFAEQLWARYWEYADQHFLEEIRRDFHARFWEMYLTCALLDAAAEHGYHLECPKPGPDIVIEHEGRRIWIEAVTATPGDPGKPDSLQPHIDGQMSRVPADKIVLRYSNAIATKHSKYCEYLAEGVVSETDSWVIAVNGWPLDYSWATGEMPRFLKALYPLGALGYAIDPSTRELVDRKHQYRPVIRKTNQSPVSTEIFVKDEYRALSAVLHSHAHAFMDQPLGSDFEIAHHPLAQRPVSTGWLPSHREWKAAAKGDGSYELGWQKGGSVPPTG